MKVQTAPTLHVVVASASSTFTNLLPLLGVVLGAVLGAALTYWFTGAAARRLRRNEQRFVGYVAIQRFLITTCDQADFEVDGVTLDPPRPRPALDDVGPELQATANLVASRQVLDSLNVYTSTLRAFNQTQQSLNAAVLAAAAATTTVSSAEERKQLDERRRELLAERDALLVKLKGDFGAANAAMRKDLDIETIDWSAYRNSTISANN